MLAWVIYELVLARRFCGMGLAPPLQRAALDQLDAERAASIGLVNQVVSGDDLMKSAFAIAGEISLNDPLAVQLTKKALNRSLEIAGLRDALRETLETDIEIETTETAESIEFVRVLAAEGPRAAIVWRAAQLPKDQ